MYNFRFLFYMIPVVLVMSVGMWRLVKQWQEKYGYIEWEDFTREDAATVFLLSVFTLFIGFLSNLIYTILWEV